MHAIPTEYDGRLYRSRLEARWAVFMDAIEVRFDYEPEAFELDGISYLPDFWLPAQGCYYEIKGSYPTQNELDKAHRLARFTQRNVYIEYRSPRLPDWGEGDSALCIFPNGEDNQYWWGHCELCGRIELQFNARADRISCKCQGRGKESVSATRKLVDGYERAKGFMFWTPGVAR